MQSSCGECPEVAMIRTAKVAFQAVERVLPAGCPGFQVDAQFLVEAFDNIGRVDLRVGSHNCGLLSVALCAAAPGAGGGEPVLSACAP
jgi:hypothetical protein